MKNYRKTLLILSALIVTLLSAGTFSYADKGKEMRLILSLSGSGHSGHWWTGLTEKKKFVYLRLNSKFELIDYREKQAKPEEIKILVDHIMIHNLLNTNKEYSAPLNLLRKPPGFPLTRLKIWIDSYHHEISISGLQFAPPSVRKLITQFTEFSQKKTTKPVPEVDTVATFTDMDRFYRKNRTYAQLRINKGHKFHETKQSWWEDNQPEFLEAIKYPGMFIPVAREQLSIIPGLENNRRLIKNAGKHLELRVFNAGR